MSGAPLFCTSRGSRVHAVRLLHDPSLQPAVRLSGHWVISPFPARPVTAISGTHRRFPLVESLGHRVPKRWHLLPSAGKSSLKKAMHLIILVECIGVTLVNEITRVSGAHFQNTSPDTIVRSPPQVRSRSITIYPPRPSCIPFHPRQPAHCCPCPRVFSRSFYGCRASLCQTSTSLPTWQMPHCISVASPARLLLPTRRSTAVFAHRLLPPTGAFLCFCPGWLFLVALQESLNAPHGHCQHVGYHDLTAVCGLAF